MTVMFCDLVESTALFTELDAEEIRGILQTFLRRCADLIEMFGGFVAQYQGDGVLGYFGYTEASENNAEQAVRVALEIVGAANSIFLPRRRHLRARVGVSTGLAIVGGSEGQGTRLELGAVGETLHLAARIQATAQPDEVIIADATRRLTGGLFAYRDLGRQSLRGFAEPVHLWRVLGPRTAVSQFRARVTPLLTPIVGRDAEIAEMWDVWRQVSAGSGRILSIVGDAGIGKSRLVNEFRHRLARERHLWLEGGGAQSFSHAPFHAIAQMIKRALDPVGHASSFQLRSRLERVMSDAGMRVGDALLPIAEILGLLSPEAVSAQTASASERRVAVFENLFEWLRLVSQRRPVVIVLEDLHWLDPSSLALTQYIIQRIQTLPALLIYSTRSTFNSPLVVGAPSTSLKLQRLTDDDLRQVVIGVRRTAVLLTDENIEHAVTLAEGVPLFAIELARLVGEQRARADEREIPATLTDLLTARLDQLGPPRLLAQVAAVIGDQVPPAVLEAVSELPARRFRSQLQALIKSGVLQTRRLPYVHHAFSHSLLQQVAYETLLRSGRRELHRRAAVVISDHFVEIANSRPELLAYHWTRGGELEVGIAAWKRAGDIATFRKAFGEAEQLYQNGITTLMELPVSPERDTGELTLRSLLADVFRMTRGFSARETVEATARARALSDRNGDHAQQLLQMWGEWTAASSGGNMITALRLAHRLYELAVIEGSPSSLAHGHMIEMTSRYRVGDLAGADDHFRRGEEVFAASEFRRRPGVIAQTYGNAAMIAWLRGHDAEAQRRIDYALTVSRNNNNPYDYAYAQAMAAIHLAVLGEFEAATDLAQKGILLSDKHAFPQFGAICRVALGRAKAQKGFSSDGMALIRDGLARMSVASMRVAITRYTTWLAEELLRAGSTNEALVAVEQALQVNPEETFFRPETLRVRGEIRVHIGSSIEGEQDFLEAIKLANQMGARRLRDRSTSSLQRLLLAPLG
jgi:class 3 adenylate cyclase